MASSVAVLHGDDLDFVGQGLRGYGFRHREVQEFHALESQALSQRARTGDQFVTRLDAEDACFGGIQLEEEVMQDEAEVGLARAVVNQAEILAPALGVLQQRFDELEQVIHLLELAPAVLVELAVAGEDVEFLEQFDGLLGPDVVGLVLHAFCA